MLDSKHPPQKLAATIQAINPRKEYHLITFWIFLPLKNLHKQLLVLGFSQFLFLKVNKSSKHPLDSTWISSEAIVSLNCLSGQEYAGHLCADQKALGKWCEPRGVLLVASLVFLLKGNATF